MLETLELTHTYLEFLFLFLFSQFSNLFFEVFVAVMSKGVFSFFAIDLINNYLCNLILLILTQNINFQPSFILFIGLFKYWIMHQVFYLFPYYTLKLMEKSQIRGQMRIIRWVLFIFFLLLLWALAFLWSVVFFLESFQLLVLLKHWFKSLLRT